MHLTKEVEDFIRAPKPNNFTAYHFAFMLCLMAEAPPSKLSQTTIADRTGMSQGQVSEVTDTVKGWDWIKKVGGKRRKDTNTITVLYENLPVYEPAAPLEVSEAAQRLAVHYKDMFLECCTKYTNKKDRHCIRPLRKDWHKRWPVVFQRLLNEGYTWNELAGILNTAGNGNKAAAGKVLAQGPQSRKLFPIKEAL